MPVAARSSRPLLTYAAAVGMGFLGTWGVSALEARRPALPAPAAATVRAPAIVVEAEEPPPSPDSLAALLLVDSPRNRPVRRSESAMLLDIIAATEQLWSASERASVLIEIAALPALDASIVTAVGRAAAHIPSADTRSEVLRTLIHRQPHAVGASRAAVLDATSSMMSSSERAETLELFLTRPRLAERALIDALASVARLPSNGDRSSALVAAARANRIEGRARAAYLRAAAAIPSERHRSRALSAIGARSRSHEGHRH